MIMAKDPVCGRTINEQQSVGRRPYEGQTYHFCQTICRELFEQNPRRYVSPPAVMKIGETGGHAA